MKESLPRKSTRLPDLLNQDTIELDLEAVDWREGVRLAGQILLRAGSITSSYAEAMIKVVEELGPYMVVDVGVALAHARPEDGVKRPCMSLVRLATPVEFGSQENDPVDLIFAFGAVDKEAHLEALRDLATFLQDKEAVAALRRCRTIEEAAEIIGKHAHKGAV
jgi:mannitol/fructose-specific phosphotransferase system IIA component (Ntr-type)